MVRWLLENIQVVIAVAAVIAYWLNQRRREKAGDSADYDGDGIPDNQPTKPEYDTATMELDEADRTRRVMEELRRKKAERAGASVAPAAPVTQPAPTLPQSPSPSRRFDAPPPVFKDPVAEMMKDLAGRFLHEEPKASLVDEAALARQRELEEKMRLLDEERAAALKRAASLRASANAQVQKNAELQGSIFPGLAGLRDPLALRQAIVMNEILGKPVGLR